MPVAVLQVERALSIADHPALPIKIAYAMRVYASAGAVQLRFPPMASELIFAAAYSARVAIPIEPASVCHRNGQSGPRMFERRKRSGCGRNRKRDDNADQPCKREKFFHSVFPNVLSQISEPRDCVVQNVIRACTTVDLVYLNIRHFGIPNGEPYAA